MKKKTNEPKKKKKLYTYAASRSEATARVSAGIGPAAGDPADSGGGVGPLLSRAGRGPLRQPEERGVVWQERSDGGDGARRCSGVRRRYEAPDQGRRHGEDHRCLLQDLWVRVGDRLFVRWWASLIPMEASFWSFLFLLDCLVTLRLVLISRAFFSFFLF